MGPEDMIDKAKELISDHQSEVDGAIDSAKSAIEDRTPDQVDGMVEAAAEKVKEID